MDRRCRLWDNSLRLRDVSHQRQDLSDSGGRGGVGVEGWEGREARGERGRACRTLYRTPLRRNARTPTRKESTDRRWGGLHPQGNRINYATSYTVALSLTQSPSPLRRGHIGRMDGLQIKFGATKVHAFRPKCPKTGDLRFFQTKQTFNTIALSASRAGGMRSGARGLILDPVAGCTSAFRL